MRLGVIDINSAPRWEALENRVFLSAAPLDVTNTYAGTITFKIGKTKLKEAIGVSLGTQSASGFVTGTVTTDHFGSVNVAGQLAGKKLKLIGTSTGGLLQVKVGKNASSLSGVLIDGADDSKGKFKVKVIGGSTPATAAAASNAVAHPLAAPGTGTGGLDPTIDPTTGLPIDPVTGQPIDPGTTVGDTGEGTGTPPIDPAGSPTPSAPGGGAGGAGAGAGGAGGAGAGAGGAGGPVIQPQAAGTLIGNNYSFTGIWVGTFNADGSGAIVDPNNPANTTPVNGTEPGTDVRIVTFTTTAQDVTGLVSGTVDIERFGTFIYTGFVNVAHIDLALAGTSIGASTGTMTLDLDPATNFSTFSTPQSQLINGVANGFVANGPIDATFQMDIPPPPVPLPSGSELYHVDTTDSQGNATLGNFDPGGGSIGEDFSVGGTPLVINSLGAFDDGADGLNNTIRVAIYNTSAPGAPIVVVDLTTANTQLFSGSSFRYMTTFTPVTLTTGVYRIVAWGYGGTELAGDWGVSNYQGAVPVDATGPNNEIQYPVSNSLNSNNYISNTGNNIVFPRIEQGLPLNRYLAASALFDFGTVPPSPPPGPPVVPPPPLTKPGNSAYPGGVFTGTNGQDVFGSQSGGIIPP
jgi:hypothetical protein